jgi:hypothetical protein
LKLTLHAGKTRVVDLGGHGFDFLGFHFHKRSSRRTGRLVPYAWPSQKAMQTVREKIRQQTERTRLRWTSASWWGLMWQGVDLLMFVRAVLAVRRQHHSRGAGARS